MALYTFLMIKKKVIAKDFKTKNSNRDPKMVIYQAKSGAIEMRGDFNRETIWATQEQISGVFDVERSVVTKHIRNIINEGELQESSVCANFAHTASDGKTYQVKFYNLDVILAVGYRTNSKKAILFRKWATETLRKFIVHGFVLNEKRFRESHINTLKDIQKTVAFIQEVALRKQLNQGEMESLLSVVRDYAHSWELLGQYDKGDVVVVSSKKKTKLLDYESVRNALYTLRDELIKKGEAGDLFAKERDGTFQGILKTIHQTFDGKELYASLEEKAANLLYFVIKDHPFFDGNKRSGAFLFIWFLQINKSLMRKTGERKINDSALVALALLVAQSDPRDKEQMVALTTQLIK